jgi:hypothetical protein
MPRQFAGLVSLADLTGPDSFELTFQPRLITPVIQDLMMTPGKLGTALTGQFYYI